MEEIIIETFEHIKDEFGNDTRYIISDFGTCINSDSGKEIKPISDKTGRKSLSLWINGKKTTKSIPQYMFNAHSIHPSKGESQIDHIDGDKTNNYIGNLEWVTPSENVRRAYKLGVHSKNSKISEKDVYYICELLELGYNTNKVSQLSGISSSIVSRIKCGRAWTDISSKFTFLDNHNKRKSPIKYSDTIKNQIKTLIIQGYTNSEITEKLKLEKSKSLTDLFGNIRRKV